MAKRTTEQGTEVQPVALIAKDFMGIHEPIRPEQGSVYMRLFDPEAFDSTIPSTDDIRARIKTFE